MKPVLIKRFHNQAIPQAGHKLAAGGTTGASPVHQPHEYERAGTAKLLTLLHPATGQVRVKGVSSSANAVLHPWLQEQLSAIVDELPPLGPVSDPVANRAPWERWQDGLTEKFTPRSSRCWKSCRRCACS